MKSKKMLNNRKGITPIISVILLLMMTIAIAGLAYSWLQKIQGSITTSTENRTDELLGGLSIELKVDGYFMNCTTASNLTTFYVRNSGQQATSNARIFVDDQYFVNSTGGTNSTYSRIAAGEMVTFAVNATDGCNFFNETSRTVKVVSDDASVEKIFTFTCSTGNCIGG